MKISTKWFYAWLGWSAVVLLMAGLVVAFGDSSYIVRLLFSCGFMISIWFCSEVYWRYKTAKRLRR